MSTPEKNTPDDFQMDLLGKQVTEGVTPAEQRALESLDPAVRSRQIAELERELRMRKRVYAELVGTGRMSPAKADRQMAVLASAIARKPR